MDDTWDKARRIKKKKESPEQKTETNVTDFKSCLLVDILPIFFPSHYPFT